MNWEQKNLRLHVANIIEARTRLLVVMPPNQGNWIVRIVTFDERGVPKTDFTGDHRDDGTYFVRLADAKAAAEAAVARS